MQYRRESDRRRVPDPGYGYGACHYRACAQPGPVPERPGDACAGESGSGPDPESVRSIGG